MASIIDERGFNQGFKLTAAQVLRLRRRAERIAAAMADRAKQNRVLELGCGTGELAAELARITEAHVTGVDLSQKFISLARETHVDPRLDFQVADLTRELPVSPDSRYDYIVGNGILHHLYHQLDEVLPRLALWLNPGGRLVFWEPNLCNPYIHVIFSYSAPRRWARLEPDEMAFSAGFIRNKLLRAGYAKISATPRDYLLPNTPSLLVKPVIFLGDILERVPLLRITAQSLFIVAEVET